MNEVDALERLLAAAREGLSPADAQIERMWAALPAGAAAAPNAAVQAPRAGRWAAFKATGNSGLAAAALLVGGGFVAGYLARPMLSDELAQLDHAPPLRAREQAPAPSALLQPTAPMPPPVALPAALPEGASVELAPIVRERAKALEASAPRAKLEALSSPVQSDSARTAAELALLERIERALRNRDAPLALALLAELELQHPHTRLAEERRAARFMANCLAAAPGARAAAQAFVADHPTSVYASRLRALCELPTR